MPVKTKVGGGLIHCGKCGKRYSNPLTHTCFVRGRHGKTRVKPKFTVSLGTCGKCGAAYSNPLTHVCKDFKGRKEAQREAQRKAAAERRKEATAKRKEAARAGPPRRVHNYVTCRDPDCERKTCEAFRDGYVDGFEDGRFA